MDYGEAKSLIFTHAHNVRNGHGRVANLDPNLKKIAYRTFLKRQRSASDEVPESYIVEYLGNPIIHFHHDNFIVNDCGWFSYSTHQRLNEFMPKGFRVSGATPRWLGSPVGFVHTPVGVFPYNMSMRFNYNGRCIDEYSEDAGQALHKVPAYVEAMLTQAFAGVADKRIESAYSNAYENIDSPEVARMIMKNWYILSLLVHATAGAGDVFDGVSLPTVVELLLHYGADIFKRSKTKGHTAAIAEVVLTHGVRPPTIHRGRLKSLLRQLMINTLVNDLGFAKQEWNRR